MSTEFLYIVPSSNERILDQWFSKSAIDRTNTKVINFSKENPPVKEINEFLDEILNNSERWIIICEEDVKLLGNPALLLTGKNPDIVFGVTGASRVIGDALDMEVLDARNGDYTVATKQPDSLGQGILMVHSSLLKNKSIRFDDKFNDYYMVDFSLQCRKLGLGIGLLPLHCEFRFPSLGTQVIIRNQKSLREKYADLLPIGTWDGPVSANPNKDLRVHARLKDKKINDYMIKNEQLLARKVDQPSVQIVRRASESDLDELEKKLVWIFGGPRSGTTWLAGDILKREGIGMLNESLIGNHIGIFRDDIMLYYQIAAKGREDPTFERSIDMNRDNDNRFFAAKYENIWLNSLRSMILERVAAQFEIEKHHCIVMKSPNESHAADIIMKALPNSKLIFLVRDGRDVIDSRSGAFHNPVIKKRPNTPEERKYRLTYYSTLWNLHVAITNKAYEAHNADLRLFLRYEDLRLDPINQIGKIFRFLDIKIADEEVHKIAEETKFENVPEDQRGEDKNIRKATPGAWRQNFNEAETALMNKIMGNNLLKFGYEL